MLANRQIIVRQIRAGLGQLRYQRVLLAALVAVLLFAGLHPFNFVPRNQVAWLQQRHGVKFYGYGEMRAVWNANHVESPADNGGGITLELWVKCSQIRLQEKELMVVSHASNREALLVFQYGSLLIITGVADEDGKTRMLKLGADDALHAGVPAFITITASREGTVIYVDGAPRERAPGVFLRPDNFEGTVLLGQIPEGRQEWDGEIYGLASYPKALTPQEVAAGYDAWKREDWLRLQQQAPTALYRFDESAGSIVHNRARSEGDLTISQRLRPLTPVILERPSKRDLTNVSDVTLNIVGFIPFGVLLVLYLTNRGWTKVNAVVAAIVVGFAISLVIELLQALLPSRDSSLLDLINNTLGSVIGARIGAYTWPVQEHDSHRALSGNLS